MGYTVVRIRLEDGRIFDQVLISNEGFLSRIRGVADIPFEENDISEIVPTHERWDWKEMP